MVNVHHPLLLHCYLLHIRCMSLSYYTRIGTSSVDPHNIIYNIIWVIHLLYYMYYTHDMIFHYDIWRNDTRPLHVWWPPAGRTTVGIIHGEDIWSAVSFWFFRIFFSPLCVSLLRRGRYTDCDSPRLLLRNKLYTRYYTHIVVVGRNCGLTSFMWLITNYDQ